MPSGAGARITANLAALRTPRNVQATGATATVDQQATLAGWSSWGAVPQVFDESNPLYAEKRTQLRGLLTEQEWDAAGRTTINAHYTDPAYVTAMWAGLRELGFTGGAVLGV